MNQRRRPDQLAFVALIILLLAGCTQFKHLEVRLVTHPPFVYPGAAVMSHEDRNAPFLSIADPLAAVFFGLWLLKVLVRKEWHRLALAPLPFWALPVIAVLSGLRAINVLDPLAGSGPIGERPAVAALPEILQLTLYFVCAYLLFANGLCTHRQMHIALHVFLAVASVLILAGTVSYLKLGSAVPAAKQPFSLFGNRYVYCGFLVMSVPVFLGLAMHERRLPYLLWFGLMVTLGLVTMLSGAHLIVAAGVLLAMAAARSRRALTTGLVVTVVALLIMPAVLPINWRAGFGQFFTFEEPTRPDTPIEEPTVIKQRWMEWVAALRMAGDPFGANFVLGVGPGGNYQLNVGSYYASLPNQDTIEPDTYNSYLVTFGSMGFLGLAALVGAMGWALRRAYGAGTAAAAAVHPGLALGLQGAVLAIVLVNIFGNTFVRGLYVPVFFLFALAAACSAAGPQEEGETITG
ncbi:MAG: O-antigen ligase family protein [Armatimonadota bacterium]